MAAVEQYQEELSGYMRFRIMGEWVKRGCPGVAEDFVKAVCKAKNIKYMPPRPKPKQ